MGKNGDALRQRKIQTSTYTFTRARLEEHDEMVIKARIEKIRADLYAQMEKDFAQKAEEANRAIEEEWKRREELFKGDDWSSNFFLLLSFLLAVSSRVLVERFGWAPLPKDRYYNHRYRLARFGDAVAEEISGICNDEMKDIRRYCDEVYDLYGVKFQLEEEEGDAVGASGDV